jgi:hypothetical protein
MKPQIAESIHHVEVSGWNQQSQFFVERADLHLDKGGDKFVSMHSNVQDGSLIFLRPISVSGTLGPVLTAYKIERVAEERSGSEITFNVRLLPNR